MEEIIKYCDVSTNLYIVHYILKIKNDPTLLEHIKLTDNIKKRIQDYVANYNCDILYLSNNYLESLQIINAYEFYITISDIYKQHYTEIYKILFSMFSNLKNITDEQYIMWLDGNEELLQNSKQKNPEFYYRYKDYLLTHHNEYYNKLCAKGIIEVRIDYERRTLDMTYNTTTLEIDETKSELIDVQATLTDNIFKLYYNNYTCEFDLLQAYTYYFLEKIPHLLCSLSSSTIYLTNEELKFIETELEIYKEKYDYNLYVINSPISKKIKYIPDNTLIKFEQNNEIITLNGYNDILNSLINSEINNNFDINVFYDMYGLFGFTIFNYCKISNVLFKNVNPNNYLLYELYSLLNKDKANLLLDVLVFTNLNAKDSLIYCK